MPPRLAGPGALDLARTLESGQTFRWRWSRGEDGATIAAGIVGRHALCVRADGDGLWLEAPADRAALARCRAYFGLAADAGGVQRVEAALAADPVLAAVLPQTSGIAILRQDAWETVVSFIISANNNIPKIRRSVERLARALGERLGDDGFAFPTPERLARAQRRTLAACHLGYRAAYVRAAARLIADGRISLAELAAAPIEEARAALMRVPGIGEKVADCVLLFGLGHGGAFPVDVWVARAVRRLYFNEAPRRPREIQAFARTRFGPLAGAAQQRLFCYARACLGAQPSGAGRPRPRPSPAHPPLRATV